MDAEGIGPARRARRWRGPAGSGPRCACSAGDPGGPALQWCRDGTAIPGATGAVYVPGPEDDGSALTCRVALPGGGEAVTPPLAVSYPPPVLVAEPCEEIFDQGSGPQAIAAAPWFSGEALRFAAAGAGAGIDPATGVLSIPTEAALADRVTVTARNSGGSAAGAFMVTVEGEGFELPAVAAAEWEVAAGYDPERPGRPLVEIVRVLAGPALAATRLHRSATGGEDFVACVKHPAFDDPESPFHRCWLGRPDGERDRAEALVPGTRRRTALRYSLDDPAAPLEAAVFSPDSDAKLWLVEAPARPAAAAPGWSVLPVLPKADYEAFVNRGRAERRRRAVHARRGAVGGRSGPDLHLPGFRRGLGEPRPRQQLEQPDEPRALRPHHHRHRGRSARLPAGLRAYPGRRRHCGARSYRAAALARRRTDLGAGHPQRREPAAG